MMPIKSTVDNDLFSALADRVPAIETGRCVQKPIGCGNAVNFRDFRNDLDLEEYRISGLCPKCQDEIFEGEVPGDDEICD